MRRWLPVELAVLFALLLGLWLSEALYVYVWRSNGGVIVTTPVGCAGLEVYGHPGVFASRYSWACDL